MFSLEDYHCYDFITTLHLHIIAEKLPIFLLTYLDTSRIVIEATLNALQVVLI